MVEVKRGVKRWTFKFKFKFKFNVKFNMSCGVVQITNKQLSLVCFHVWQENRGIFSVNIVTCSGIIETQPAELMRPRSPGSPVGLWRL
jgi:hypothetical protein